MDTVLLKLEIVKTNNLLQIAQYLSTYMKTYNMEP